MLLLVINQLLHHKQLEKLQKLKKKFKTINEARLDGTRSLRKENLKDLG